jgi:vacuolar-type H+-ATPase subunit H
MTEMENSSEVEEGIFTHSLSDYRSKVEEIIRIENERFRALAEEQAKGIIDGAWQKAEEIISESQEKGKGIIADSENKAYAIISDSQRKAEKLGSEIEEQANRKSSEILREAKQKAQQIIQEAEENAAKDAKNRVRVQEGKILNRASKEANSIVADARKNAERESDQIIEKTKQEAQQRVEEEIEKFRLQAKEQSTQIRIEAEKKATKLIDKIIEDGNAINEMIIDTIKSSENLLEKMKGEMQLEVGNLTKGLTAARTSMERTVTKFSESEDTAALIRRNFNKNLALWVSLKGEKTALKENGDFLFKGQIELKTLSSMDYTLVKELKGFLIKVPNVKYLGESSSEEGSILSFEIREPLPLVDILGNIPLVENVVTQGDNVKLTLN